MTELAVRAPNFRRAGATRIAYSKPCKFSRCSGLCCAEPVTAATTRDQGLQQLDALLQDDALDTPAAQEQAPKLLADLTASGAIKAFGTVGQVPKRLYTIEELRLNKIDPTALMTPQDETVDQVQAQLQAAYLAGLLALAGTTSLDIAGVGALLLVSIFLAVADQIVNGGGGQALALDTVARFTRPTYRQRVAHHEAGHFLVAYLTGLLPIAYTLSSLDAFRRYGALNIQAGCRFADAAFSKEVDAGKLKASSLQRFSCVALAGVCSESLKYGKAEGGMSDITQLDGMLRALQFNQNKADGEIRWAVLNTISMLRRHEGVRDKLAAAMDAGQPVGACIRLIEEELEGCDEL